jgi:DNA-binding NtrC family response regulator/pSer/pThr/pTyr-binding forkhead associated (FHA) protein
MPQLIICQDAQNYRVIECNRTLTIGREEDNDIILASPQVSRHHASIVREKGNGYILHDHDSTNATWVEARKIGNCRLTHGTTFRIANFFLTFIEEAESALSRVFSRDEEHGGEIKAPGDSATMLFHLEPSVPAGPSTGTVAGKSLTLAARLNTLLHALGTMEEEGRLTEELVAGALSLSSAERGFLSLIDTKGELVYRAAAHFDPDRDKADIRHDLIKEVMAFGLTRYSRKENASLRNAICVPLWRDGKTIGCLYLDRKGEDAFSTESSSVLEILLMHGGILLDNLSWRARVHEERETLKSRLAVKDETIIHSERMVKLYEDIKTIAPIRVPVFIFGEAGSGKELVASALHAFSGRKGSHVTLNCSAIPEGIFESELFGSLKGAYQDATDKPGKLELAHNGSIFLDEIADMSLQLQPKLLRFLENGEVTRLGDTRVKRLDVRVIAATNRDVDAMIRAGGFRDDLFQRLSCFILKVPPLRERPEDIESLARHFLGKFAREYNWRESAISAAALDVLRQYQWPGNIRQLRNTLLRLVVQSQGRPIAAADVLALSKDFGSPQYAKVESFTTLEEMEKNHVREALARAGGNISEAAGLVGIARSTLYQKMKKYQLST